MTPTHKTLSKNMRLALEIGGIAGLTLGAGLLRCGLLSRTVLLERQVLTDETILSRRNKYSS